MTYRFGAVVWLHSGMAGWYFITLPIDVADAIDDLTAGTRRGFGSVRVNVTIGVDDLGHVDLPGYDV